MTNFRKNFPTSKDRKKIPTKIFDFFLNLIDIHILKLVLNLQTLIQKISTFI